MDFLNLKDKIDDFRYSGNAADKLKCGAKIFGTLLANTAIAAGKVTAEVVERLPGEIERTKKK